MGFAHISHRISNVSNYKIYIGHRSIKDHITKNADQTARMRMLVSAFVLFDCNKVR